MRWYSYLLLAIFIVSSPVWAEHVPDHIKQSARVDNIPLPLTKNTAAELARIQSGGKILSVDEQKQGNRTIFRVKVLHNNGKVKIYHIDRDTGLTD